MKYYYFDNNSECTWLKKKLLYPPIYTSVTIFLKATTAFGKKYFLKQITAFFFLFPRYRSSLKYLQVGLKFLSNFVTFSLYYYSSSSFPSNLILTLQSSPYTLLSRYRTLSFNNFIQQSRVWFWYRYRIWFSVWVRILL